MCCFVTVKWTWRRYLTKKLNTLRTNGTQKHINYVLVLNKVGEMICLCVFPLPPRTEGVRKVPYHYYEAGSRDECAEYMLHESAPYGGHRFITEKSVFAKWAKTHAIKFFNPPWQLSWPWLNQHGDTTIVVIIIIIFIRGPAISGINGTPYPLEKVVWVLLVTTWMDNIQFLTMATQSDRRPFHRITKTYLLILENEIFCSKTWELKKVHILSIRSICCSES